MIAAGIYILNEKEYLLEFNKKVDMPELIAFFKRGLKLGVFPIHESWTDIGLPKDYFELMKKK